MINHVRWMEGLQCIGHWRLKISNNLWLWGSLTMTGMSSICIVIADHYCCASSQLLKPLTLRQSPRDCNSQEWSGIWDEVPRRSQFCLHFGKWRCLSSMMEHFDRGHRASHTAHTISNMLACFLDTFLWYSLRVDTRTTGPAPISCSDFWKWDM